MRSRDALPGMGIDIGSPSMLAPGSPGRPRPGSASTLECLLQPLNHALEYRNDLLGLVFVNR
jgi:hypothetical protein